MKTIDLIAPSAIPAPVRWLLTAVAVCAALFVITVPLDLRSQWVFAIVTVLGVWAIDRNKSRWNTIIICVIALLASTRYMFWRTTQTLEFDTLLSGIMGGCLYIAEFYAWIILLLGIVQTGWPMHRPAVELQGADGDLPTVDIYVPTYNESLAIVRNTVFAAMAVDYPKDRFRVFILDDGKRPEFRDFARLAGCGYLTRGDNLHAKAGNLNAALKRTDGELICIFDCDHVPTRAFLQMTVGWFQVDPKLALMQTPHYFYSPDPVQRNVKAASDMPGEGELFYGAVQSGNDLWNAAFFCGSCAIIRREALNQTNGFAGETVTEDAHTALKLQRMGWNTAYLNARLSAGLATERLVLHIGQRIRWARGMTQILRIDNPLFGPGLKFPQRLCYLNAMLHFQFPLPRIVFLTSPLAYLLAGQNIIHASAAMIFAYAIPHLLISSKSSERLQGSERRPFWGEIYESLLAFHLAKPTLLTLFNPRKGKFNVTDKGETLAQSYFDVQTLRPHLITCALLILGVAVGFIKLLFPETFDVNVDTLLLNTAWTMSSLLILIAAISVGRESKQLREDVRFAAKLPVSIYFEDGYVVDTTTENVSLSGLAVRLPKGMTLAGRTVTDVTLAVDDRTLALAVDQIALSGERARVRFKPLPIDEQRRLVGALMGRADAWQSLVRDDEPESGFKSIMQIAKVSASTLMSGQDNSHTPRNVRALASAMVTLFAIAGTFAVLGGIANARPPAARTAPAAAVATQSPDWSGAHSSRLTLKDMRIQDRIRLQGTQGEIGIPFGLRGDEVVTGARLTLTFAHSPALLPDLSQLVVIVNGEVVRSLPLTRETADGTTVTIPVDPAFFLAGDNRLNLRLIGHYTRDCEDPLNSALWANVSNTRSFLDLTVQKLPLAANLAMLPAPFFDRADGTPLKLPFVFAAAPGNGELEAAASVASWFGAQASYRGFAFKPMINSLPTGNAVVFLLTGHPVAGLDHGIGGAAVAVVPNPRDRFGSLLLVMGRTPDELKRAAAVLATRSGVLRGTSAVADGFRFTIRAPYDAPRWLRGDRPVQLGEIVDPLSLEGRGLPPGPLTAAFRIAPDLFFWPRQGAHIDIGYRYPTGSWLDHRRSRLDLSLNGQYLRTLPMAAPGWFDRLLGRDGTASAHGTASVGLPTYGLFGQNEVSFFYDLQVADRGRCHSALPTNVKASIDPTSTIDISHAYHAARMPNLAYFAGAGFPFTRTPDLGDTAVVMAAQPTEGAIEAFLALMGRFGDSTGVAATRVTVVRSVDGNQLAGKDILVVGSAALADPAGMFAAAPVQWDGSRLRVAGRSQIQRVFDLMSPGQVDAPDAVEGVMQSTDDFEGIVGFRSPFGGDHSVVALLATDPTLLPSVVYGLQDVKTNAQVQGDVAVLTDDGFRSFRTGSSYWSGSLPWWMHAAYWFSERPWLLALFAILAATIIASPIYILLKAQERRRLAQVPE